MNTIARKPFNKSIESKQYNIDGKNIRYSRSIATLLLITRGKGNDTEILIIKRGPAVKGTGRWSIPGGYLNWNESICESACREAYEETGIRINPKDVSLIGIFDQYKTKTQNVVLCFYTHYDKYNYEMPENIQEFSLNEVTEVKWIKVNGDGQDKISPSTKKLIEIAKKTKIEVV